MAGEQQTQRKMNFLLGVGNELNGDDAVGCFIADNFSARDWLCVNSGTVPGNFAGTIRREKSSVLIIIDAADMGLKAGEFRRLKKEQANSAFYSTHSLPISEFIAQVGGSVQEIVLIGIQPKNTGQFKKLSAEVQEAAEKIIELIRQGRWREITQL